MKREFRKEMMVVVCAIFVIIEVKGLERSKL